jgi:hypothetical protein
MPWNLVIVTPYMMYKKCADNRAYHDLNAEFGYGYGAYLDYLFYAQRRWEYRGEGAR